MCLFKTELSECILQLYKTNPRFDYSRLGVLLTISGEERSSTVKVFSYERSRVTCVTDYGGVAPKI